MASNDKEQISIDTIVQNIQEEVQKRLTEGPRFNIMQRSIQLHITNRNFMSLGKRESRSYRIAKKVQSMISRYFFYSVVYKLALRIKRFIPQYDDRIDIKTFLQLNGEEFIISAYEGILKRKPDNEGFRSFVAILRSGQLSKTRIIAKIRYSKEGKAKKVKIQGLIIRYVIDLLTEIPIIGYLVELSIVILRLPRTIKSYRRFEARTDETLNKIEHNLQILHSTTEQKLALIAETISKKADASIVEQMSSDFSSVLLEVQNHATTMREEVRFILRELENDRNSFTTQASLKQIAALQSEVDHLLDPLYADFEERFRGARDAIKERIAIYLPDLEKTRNKNCDFLAIDIGCGRGEWLEILKEHGFKAKGIDNNSVMVSQCRKLGLEVIEGDAIKYLTEQEPETFGLITGFHIIEHLSLSVLVQLLDEVYRTLKPGGLVIFETPNAENIMVGSTFFHIDPTHIKPIHPLTIEFLMNRQGFQKIEIRRLHAMPQQTIDNVMLHNLLFGPQDYAAIGYKV